tara:strand:+ start:1374 stop:2420 length:1047 start_codon:yes stop_codon:yes gene_type:complete
MKHILVTGGAGFIGSHTSLVLLKNGYFISVIDSFINSSKKSLDDVLKILGKDPLIHEKIKIYEGDIRDKELLNKIFKDSKEKNLKISSVIHFAGLKSVSESMQNPIKYWENNVSGTLKLIEIMEENNCRTIIFSSSATIYGLSNNKKFKETDHISPVNPYGTTKFVIEKLLENVYLSNLEDWKIANLRYFNPIGAHKSGLLGERPTGRPNNIFPIINQVAGGILKELKIYGTDWPTYDGTGVRDYIHVMDVADGHLAALEFLMKSKSTIININLGTGKGTSVLDLIKTYEKVNKIKIPLNFVDRRKGDVAFLVADNSLAKSLLNWQPRMNLAEMCLDGWRWQLNNLNG